MDGQLNGRKIAVLATDGTEESEILEPKKALEEAGAIVVVISPKNEKIQLMKHDTKTTSLPVDLELQFAMPDQFDGLLLPGGVLNADALRMESGARDFVREIERERKPIAFICHAPWLLISSQIVEGRNLTGYYTIADDIRNGGGRYHDEEVVRDDNWVSSRQPSDIPAFIREAISLFAFLHPRPRPPLFA